MIVVTKNKEITYGMIQKAVVVIFLVIADYFDPRKEGQNPRNSQKKCESRVNLC
jgi:hypothetical protein